MSKAGLIVSAVINILLLVIGLACIILLDFSVLSLVLYLVACVFVCISSVLVYIGSRELVENDK